MTKIQQLNICLNVSFDTFHIIWKLFKNWINLWLSHWIYCHFVYNTHIWSTCTSSLISYIKAWKIVLVNLKTFQKNFSQKFKYLIMFMKASHLSSNGLLWSCFYFFLINNLFELFFELFGWASEQNYTRYQLYFARCNYYQNISFNLTSVKSVKVVQKYFWIVSYQI